MEKRNQNDTFYCGLCKYNRYDDGMKCFICDNEDSECYGAATFFDDYCDLYELEWEL